MGRLRSIYKNKKGRDRPLEQELIGSLAPSLRRSLLYKSYGPKLRQIPLIQSYFSQELIENLSLLVEEVHFSSGELIFSE